MDWLSQNWFFALVLVAFVALHLFGHGGHGGHGGQGGHGGRDRPIPDLDEPPDDRSARDRHHHHIGP